MEADIRKDTYRLLFPKEFQWLYELTWQMSKEIYEIRIRCAAPICVETGTGPGDHLHQHDPALPHHDGAVHRAGDADHAHFRQAGGHVRQVLRRPAGEPGQAQRLHRGNDHRPEGRQGLLP